MVSYKKKKKKTRIRRLFADKIAYAALTDNLAVFAITHTQGKKSLLRGLEQAARSIGLYVNSDKTEIMCFVEVVLFPQ